MRKKSWIVSGVVLVVLLSIGYFRWSSAIRQPLAFSHAQHVDAQIPCTNCHATPDVLPAVPQCKQCHIERNFPPKVQWVKVYRVAPDIIFGHTEHADVPCSTCHEKFTSGDQWIYESRFKMSFCMDCHEDTGASNECRTCHINK